MFINKYIKLFLKKRKVEKIHKLQNIYVKKYMSSNTKSLVLFIVPASNDVNGGMLSISSIFDETVKIKNIHKSEVLACTSPKGRTIFKYTKFENNLNILRFEQIQKYFNNLKKIIIHIPEFHCQNFINKDFKFIKKWLSDIEFVHFNILNQNIKLMPKTAEINKLKSFCNLLTNTTAHKAYSTQNFKDKYNIPLHHLSTFVSPERYMHKKYVYKKNIIIISPDNNENKNKIIEKIKNELSQYKIIIIKNLTYHEYKKVI